MVLHRVLAFDQSDRPNKLHRPVNYFLCSDKLQGIACFNKGKIQFFIHSVANLFPFRISFQIYLNENAFSSITTEYYYYYNDI